MKTYNQLSEEIQTQEAEKLAADIKSSFEKHFPNGFIVSRVEKSLGDSIINVVFGLISDESDLESNIRQNDPLFHRIMINIEGDTYEAKSSQSGLSIEPEKGSFRAMSNVKTPFRKTKGDSKKIMKAFDRFFPRVSKIVKDNEENVYRRSTYDDKYFDVK